MKNNVTKDVVPNDFTLSLALVDAIPVIIFCLNMIIVGKTIDSSLFIFGAILCLWAGLAKVIWKIIVVLRKKNIWFLFVQMRLVMPIGLLMIIVSLLLNRNVISSLLIKITNMPSLLFLIFGLLGMGLMVIFGFTLDGTKTKNNWIEQTTNIIAQLCFLISLMIL